MPAKLLSAANKKIAELRQQLEAYENAMRFLPGLAIGIVKDGERVFLSGPGILQGGAKTLGVYDLDGYLTHPSATHVNLGDGYNMAFRGSVDTLVEMGDNEKVFDDLEVIVWSSYPDGSIKYLNKSWFKYSGITPKQLRQNGSINTTHADDFERALGNWRRCISSGQSYTDEYRRRSADGDYRWFLSNCNPISNCPIIFGLKFCRGC